MGVKMQRIKVWKDLEKYSTESKKIAVDNEDIVIYDKDFGAVFSFSYAFWGRRMAKEALEAIGFNVSFIEINSLPKAEWHQIRVFESGWIARDEEDDEISLWEEKPIRGDKGWLYQGGRYFKLPIKMFPFITWESEPWSIEELMELKMAQ